MKTFIEYDNRTGEVLKALFQREEAALLGLGPNSSLKEVDEESFKIANSRECYYFENSVHELPPKPKQGYKFNYSLRQWEDIRTLEEVRAAHWEKLKKDRDSLEFGGFTYKGMIFDSDQISQGRILAAASLGKPIEWTLADNSNTLLLPEDLQGLVIELSNHITSVHNKGRIIRELIFSSDDINTIEDITFSM